MFPSKILYPGVPVILLNSKQYDVIMNNTTFIFHDSFLLSLICIFFFIYCFERGNSQFMIINDFKIHVKSLVYLFYLLVCSYYVSDLGWLGYIYNYILSYLIFYNPGVCVICLSFLRSRSIFCSLLPFQTNQRL